MKQKNNPTDLPLLPLFLYTGTYQEGHPLKSDFQVRKYEFTNKSQSFIIQYGIFVCMLWKLLYKIPNILICLFCNQENSVGELIQNVDTKLVSVLDQ